MTLSPSLLVRVVAPQMYEHASAGCWTIWELISDAEREHWYARAEVAVGAVLDALSEGPLHDAMVEAARSRLDAELLHSEPLHEKVATLTTDAALALARTYNEEG